MENSETQGWLNFAKECGYILNEEYNGLYALSNETGRLIQYMIENPSKFGVGK